MDLSKLPGALTYVASEPAVTAGTYTTAATDGAGNLNELLTARQPFRAAPDGVTRVEWRRFLKALRKKQKQARCRGYSP